MNAYLKSVSGEEFTSKDFRTWAGTLLCARALPQLPPPPSAAAGKRELAQAIEAVARELRNTRAVCRKCYVHPARAQAPRAAPDQASKSEKLVEWRRIELPTFALRTRRSPS